MGIYCNPEIGKFEWFEKNAIAISKKQAIEFQNKRKNNDYVILCHVDNGMFTALAVMYSNYELEYFTTRNDGRPKSFFLANYEDVEKLCPEIKNYF